MVGKEEWMEQIMNIEIEGKVIRIDGRMVGLMHYGLPSHCYERKILFSNDIEMRGLVLRNSSYDLAIIRNDCERMVHNALNLSTSAEDHWETMQRSHKPAPFMKEYDEWHIRPDSRKHTYYKGERI